MITQLYLRPVRSSSAKVFMRLKEEGLLGRAKIVSLGLSHDLMVDAPIPHYLRWRLRGTGSP